MSADNRSPMQWSYLAGLIVLAFLGVLLSQQLQTPPSGRLVTPTQEVSSQTEPIAPLPLALNLNQSKVTLGEQLFADARLSGNNGTSCASCHNLKLGGVDRKRYSVGASGRELTTNTLTVFNAASNVRLGWDGRFESQAQQIDALIHNADIMGSTWEEVTARLKDDSNYVEGFAQIYPEGITPDTIRDALSTYGTSLYTANSRFDQYLRGNQFAINAKELEGYRLFQAFGCVACHQGMNVGGNMFQKFGVVQDYLAKRGNITRADYGRFNVTGDEADRFVFRVPSLRNVAATAPYFHDGSVATLEQAIAVMAQCQLGRNPTPEQIDQIAAFLKTLTGEYQGQPL